MKIVRFSRRTIWVDVGGKIELYARSVDSPLPTKSITPRKPATARKPATPLQKKMSKKLNKVANQASKMKPCKVVIKKMSTDEMNVKINEIAREGIVRKIKNKIRELPCKNHI